MGKRHMGLMDRAMGGMLSRGGYGVFCIRMDGVCGCEYGTSLSS